MRWPFVSRAAYEAAERECDAWKEQACTERDRYDKLNLDSQRIIDALNARYDKLLNKYHALRVKGANAEPEKPTIQPPPPLTAVDYAIDRVTAKASPLRKAALERHLRGLVAQEKAKPNYDEESMAERIEHWQETAD